MTARKLTIEQKNDLQGIFFNDTTFFNCVPNIDNDYFIILSDSDENTIENSVYSWVLELPLIDYFPKEIIRPIINEINVDYINEIYTATLNDLTIVNIDIQNNILELKSIFEEIYINPINTTKATFTSGSVLIFNNDLTVNCATIAIENIELFNRLAELFQNIKIDIMFKIN